MNHRNEYGMITMTKQQYENAVRIAVEFERERCAQIAERCGEREEVMTDTAFVPAASVLEKQAARIIAAAIRRQGQGEKG